MREKSKYPTMAFTSEDIQTMLDELDRDVADVVTNIRRLPTKTDPRRIAITVAGFRRRCEIGQTARITATRYIAGGTHDSVDKVYHQALWALSDQLGHTPEAWGKYTELCPGFTSPKPR